MNVIIETERLLIRSPKDGDAKPLNIVLNQAVSEITPWMSWASDPSLGPTEEFIRKGIQNWQDPHPKELPLIIILKSEDEMIGASGFNVRSDFTVPMMELGYWINTKHVGNGYVTEAVIAMTRYAFEYHSAARVQICMQRENIKSRNVAERAGYIEEAILKNFKLDCLTKKPCDEVIYACFGVEQLPESKMFNVSQL